MSKLSHLLCALTILCCLLIHPTPTNSAELRPIISLNNIDLVQKVRNLGKGYLGEVKWSPDGKTLAVGSTTGIWLYNTSDFKQEPRWLGSRDFPALKLTFSPDGKKLVGYNRLSKISVWDVASEQLEQEVTLDNQGFAQITNTGSGLEYSPIYDVSFTSQGQLLVTSAFPNTDGFHVWDAFTGKDIFAHEGHVSISSMVYSPDTRTLAFGISQALYLPGEVQLWTLKTGKQTKTLTGPESPVNTVAYSANGRYIAAGSGAVPSDHADDTIDNSAWLFDARTGETLHELEGHERWGEWVTFSPNSQLLASGSGDNTIRLWTVPSGRLKSVLKGHTGWIKHLEFSSNNKWIASAAGDGSVRIWDTNSGKELANLMSFAGNPGVYVGPGASGSGFNYAFGPDNVAVGSIIGGSNFKIWNALDGTEIPVPAVTAGLSAKAQLNAFTNPQIVTKWEQEKGSIRKVLEPEMYFGARFNSDLKYLLIWVHDEWGFPERSDLWSLTSRKKIKELSYDPAYQSVMFSPDAKWLLVITHRGDGFHETRNSVLFLDVKTGEEHHRYTRKNFYFSNAGAAATWQFSADGKQFGVLWDDGLISIIDVQTGKLLWEQNLTHGSWAGVFTANLEQAAHVHSIQTNGGYYKESIEISNQHNTHITNITGTPVGFTTDDQVLFTVSENNLMAWSMKTEQLLRTFESRSQITWVQISPDGTLLTIANDDDVIEVWSIQTELF